MALSDNIRELRKKRGFTQAQLAEAMTQKMGQECYRTTINKWERGVHEPSGYFLKALSEIFDVTVDCLLGNEPDNDAPISEQLENRPVLLKLVKQLLNEDTEKIKALCVLSGIDLDKQ